MYMFTRMIVQAALNRALGWDNDTRYRSHYPSDNFSSVISQLIYDSFGGEILKTHMKKGWHFYNRINGERFDFSASEMRKSMAGQSFEDIPSAPDEIQNYFEQEEYSSIFVRFIRAFEEAVGLKKYRSGFAA